MGCHFRYVVARGAVEAAWFGPGTQRTRPFESQKWQRLVGESKSTEGWRVGPREPSPTDHTADVPRSRMRIWRR